MTIKDQWKTIKDNWLIGLLIIIVISISLISSLSGTAVTNFSAPFYSRGGGEMAVAAVGPAFKGDGIYYDTNFAPEVQDRKITRSVSISNEVERGEFRDAEDKLKAIISATDSYLLNENVYKSGVGIKSYFTGSYQLKVEVKKYSAVISQLKEIGEVQSFSENIEDVTGSYTDLKIELEAEKERLNRYLQMYKEAGTVSEKIDLNDRIFNQERTIKYLEDALKNIDNRVEYSTISIALSEKQSEYFDVMFVKFSELVRKLVSSINSLLSLVFIVLPYALVGILVWLVIKIVRKRKK